MRLRFKTENTGYYHLKHRQGYTFSEKWTNIKEARQHEGQGTIKLSISMIKYFERYYFNKLAYLISVNILQ